MRISAEIEGSDEVHEFLRQVASPAGMAEELQALVADRLCGVHAAPATISVHARAGATVSVDINACCGPFSEEIAELLAKSE